jgi:gliding motility-associated-like protein
LNGTYIDSVIVKKPLVTTIEAGILDICRDQSVTLTSSETSLPSAIWDFGDGTLINLANSNASHKYATPGIYKPALLVKNTDGCTSSTKLTESINVRPDPIITITPAAPVLCKGNSIQLNAQVSKGINYIWTPDKSLDNAAIASPTASPLNSTTYTVKVTDDIGCSNTNSVSIFVAQPISVKVIADTPVCADKTLQMYAYGATTYKWINTVTGLSRTDIANPVLTPYASDVYTVAGYDAYNCFSDTVLLPVRVVPLPTVHASPKNTVVLAGSSVQLTATGSSDIVRWEWSPYNYLSCTNCPDPVSNVLDDITYTITVKNKEGCSVSDNVEIKTICEAERVAVPNAFTPNNDGRNDVFKISGIGMIKYLAIYDRWGIKVFERSNFIAGDRASCWDGNYRGSPLPAGTYVYIINMQCKGGNSFSQSGTVILIR